MTEDRSPAVDLKAAWRAQPREIEPMVLEKVRADANKAQRRLGRAMAIEFVAAAAVVAVTVWMWPMTPQPLIRFANALMMVWVVFYLWRWTRAFGPRRTPDDALACLDFHRAQLARMRGELLRSWRWTTAPVLVMFVLIGIGRWTGPPAGGRPVWLDHLIIPIAGACGLETVAMLWLWMLHRADKLQDRIDELDALGRTP